MREEGIVAIASGHGGGRRGYTSPQLTVYGGLAELTATGSDNAASESGGGPSDMQCVTQYKKHMDCGF